jgi:diketogulonate reductase-like aldo/keto reductase
MEIRFASASRFANRSAGRLSSNGFHRNSLQPRIHFDHIAALPSSKPVPSQANGRLLMKSNARKEAVAREVVAVARESGHSPAQVALAWLRQRPEPVIPIIGARKLAQVKDNLACVGVNLAPAHIDRLHAVSRIELGFPHDFYAMDMVRSLSSGGMRDQIDA